MWDSVNFNPQYSSILSVQFVNLTTWHFRASLASSHLKFTARSWSQEVRNSKHVRKEGCFQHPRYKVGRWVNIMLFYNQLTFRMAWKNPVEFFPKSNPIEFQDMLGIGLPHPSNDAMEIRPPGVTIRNIDWRVSIKRAGWDPHCCLSWADHSESELDTGKSPQHFINRWLSHDCHIDADVVICLIIYH